MAENHYYIDPKEDKHLLIDKVGNHIICVLCNANPFRVYQNHLNVFHAYKKKCIWSIS